MSMDISLIKHGTQAELKLNGFIDATNATEVEKVLVDVAAQYDSLVFDMEKLERAGEDPRSGMAAFRLQIRGDLNETRMKKLIFRLSGECEDFRILGCAGCSPEEKTAE